MIAAERVLLTALCDKPRGPHVVARVLAAPAGMVVELRELVTTRAGATWQWGRYDPDAGATTGRCPCGREFDLILPDLAARAGRGERSIVLWPAGAFSVPDQLAVVERRARRGVRGTSGTAL